jgi:hypothetical protein
MVRINSQKQVKGLPEVQVNKSRGALYCGQLEAECDTSDHPPLVASVIDEKIQNPSGKRVPGNEPKDLRNL